MEKLCECCHRPKSPLGLVSFEFGGLYVRACFHCLRHILGKLSMTPLAERAEQLASLQAGWRQSRRKREEVSA